MLAHIRLKSLRRSWEADPVVSRLAVWWRMGEQGCAGFTILTLALGKAQAQGPALTSSVTLLLPYAAQAPDAPAVPDTASSTSGPISAMRRAAPSDGESEVESVSEMSSALSRSPSPHPRLDQGPGSFDSMPSSLGSQADGGMPGTEPAESWQASSGGGQRRRECGGYALRPAKVEPACCGSWMQARAQGHADGLGNPSSPSHCVPLPMSCNSPLGVNLTVQSLARLVPCRR